MTVRFILAAATVLLFAGAAGRSEAGPTIALLVQAIEGSQETVEAQFNPSEITISKRVPWQRSKKSSSDAPTLEFTGARPKTLQVELFFDEFENGGDVYLMYIAKLEEMTQMDDALKRPPLVKLVWGNQFPVFQGVIENMEVRYTMFAPDGTPARATVDLRMRQANQLTVGSSRAASPSCILDSDCEMGQVCRDDFCQNLTSPRR